MLLPLCTIGRTWIFGVVGTATKIAAALGIPLGAAGTTVRRIRRVLKRRDK